MIIDIISDEFGIIQIETTHAISFISKGTMLATTLKDINADILVSRIVTPNMPAHAFLNQWIKTLDKTQGAGKLFLEQTFFNNRLHEIN